jgi:hypothetical protein
VPGQARLSLVRESPLIRLTRGPSRHHELLLRAVRHEALPYRMEVRDLRGLAVVAVG